MKRIKLFEQFVYESEFPSALDIGDCVNFKPMARHAEKYCIDREQRFGKVVAVRFTIAKVFYDVLDDYLGIIFDGVDSVFVEPSESRKTLDINIEIEKEEKEKNKAIVDESLIGLHQTIADKMADSLDKNKTYSLEEISKEIAKSGGVAAMHSDDNKIVAAKLKDMGFKIEGLDEVVNSK